MIIKYCGAKHNKQRLVPLTYVEESNEQRQIKNYNRFNFIYKK